MLVEKGKVTPDVAKKLSSILIGEVGSRNEMSLSLGAENTPSIASRVLSALNENDIIKLGEKTGHQILSRTTPSDSDNTDKSKPSIEGGNAMSIGANVAVDEEKE